MSDFEDPCENFKRDMERLTDFAKKEINALFDTNQKEKSESSEKAEKEDERLGILDDSENSTEDLTELDISDEESLNALADREVDIVFEMCKKGKEKNWSREKIHEEIWKEYERFGII